MSAPLNDRDALLQSAGVRVTSSQTARVSLTASSSVFSDHGDGTADPAQIVFTANLFDLAGTVTFSAAGCALAVAGNVATLDFDDMSANTAVVTASLVVGGVTYESNPCSVTKIATDSAALDAINDPLTGLQSRLRNNADQVLGAVLSVDVGTNPAGFRAGTLAWNQAGQRTSGYGTALTPLGLVGYKSDGTLTFAINADTGAAVFGGELLAATGSFGQVTVDAGGSIAIGQTDYHDGTGIWAGFKSGVPKLSIGTPGVSSFRWDGTKIVIENADLLKPSFTLSVSHPAGDYFTIARSATIDGSGGHHTVTPVGRTGTFTYSWNVQPPNSFVRVSAPVYNTSQLNLSMGYNGIAELDISCTCICTHAESGDTATANFVVVGNFT